MIKILKNISYINGCNNSDKIITFLIRCLLLYSLTEYEMRKFSIWEQEYNYEGGITNFATITVWLSIIESVNINLKLL